MSDPSATFRSMGRIESGVLEWLEENVFEAREKSDGLTIAVPNWNHRPHLPRAVRSALRAAELLEGRGCSAEVVVVDDASRDGSQRMLRSMQMLYGEGRLRTLFLPRNVGLSRVRNIALRAARFRHICWLDSDNELIPENLPLFTRSIMDTGATAVYGNLIDVRGGRPAALRSSMEARMGLSRGNHIDAFALFDAERVRRLGGYHPWFYSGSDWEMILHLVAEEQEIVFVPAVLGYYSVSGGSMSREARGKRQEVRSLQRRMYAQSGTREWDPVKVGRIYHPELGYLD